MTQLWSSSKANCPREQKGENDYDWIGKTCQCGQHLKECPACGRKYHFWNNPHYQGGVGHDTSPNEVVEEPFYVCTKELAHKVHGRKLLEELNIEPGPF